MVFKSATDNNLSFSFPYADSTAEATDVKALATAMITNKAIYAEPPVSVVGAEFVTTSKSDIDLS
jgi:hypothetical protein